MHPIGAGVVPYYMDREHPGRWSEAATRLLGMDGPVEAAALRLVLQGRHPHSGRYLPAVRPARRRGGWDLIFTAPKSVSLLAASCGPDDRASVGRAHVGAVDAVTAVLEDRAEVGRVGPGGAHPKAEGLVAAAFDHETNSAAEPHLHTHLLVANLSRAGGAWSSVRIPLITSRPALAALYDLELRHQMRLEGWRLEWRLRSDGMADLADTPRAAIRAASTQGLRSVTDGRIEARRQATVQPWQGRVAAAGLLPEVVPGRSPGDAVSILDLGRVGGELGDPALESTVALRLTARRSDFRIEDVIVALAGCHPGGASAREAIGWAERFCAESRSVPSPVAGRRWTTEAAERTDRDLWASLCRPRTPLRAGPIAGPEVEEVIRGGRMSPESADQVRLLTSGPGGVHFLSVPPGRTALLAQAEVVSAARRIWEGAGLDVALHSPSADGARRWEVLTGIPAARPGNRPDVLIVDRADRRTTSELARLVGGSSARLVFVEGGTLPRLTNPASHGLRDVAERTGRLLAPPHLPWKASTSGLRDDSGPATGRVAAESLVAAWRDGGGEALLVGLGLDELAGLNQAAMALRGGGPSGPYGVRDGDRVVVLKGRPGLPPFGTFGTVVEASTDLAPATRKSGRGPLVVAWSDGTMSATRDRWTADAVGPGYAVMPTIAARSTGPLMVLGPAESLSRGRDRVVADVALAASARERDRAAGRGLPG